MELTVFFLWSPKISTSRERVILTNTLLHYLEWSSSNQFYYLNWGTTTLYNSAQLFDAHEEKNEKDFPEKAHEFPYNEFTKVVLNTIITIN